MRIFKTLGNLLLLVVALLLFFPLTIVNLCYVRDISGYFFETALGIDIYAQYEFRTLWNNILIKPESMYRFGKDRRVSISYLLGKNKQEGTLSEFGKIVADILNWLDKHHCEIAVALTEAKYPDLMEV